MRARPPTLRVKETALLIPQGELEGPDAPLTADDRYRLLVEAVTDYAIYMLDSKGIVTSWNPGAQRFKGYDSSEIIGQHFSVFYTDEDRRVGLPQTALERAAREGRFEHEGWRVRKDGTRFWAHVIIDPIRKTSGEIVGYAKITRDIGNRQKASNALLRTEEQFRRLTQSTTEYSICMLDENGRVANWNSGAQRIDGYAPEGIIGKHFSRFYTEEDRAADVPASMLSTAAKNGRVENEGWHVRKDGSRFWANIIFDAIPEHDGRIIGYAMITRDITEQKETQKALEEAREALFQSQKMDAIGQLTGGLAHDFNNLLAEIIGSLQLAELRLSQKRFDDLSRYLNFAQTASTRAAALTHRLLAFARRQTLDTKPTNIEHLIKDMKELIDRTMGPAINVVVAPENDLWHAMVDPNQLENALLNLCINARDAMPSGGDVTIMATNLEDEQRTPDYDLEAGAYIELTVRDTGTGMPNDVIDRAFEPFFTTKPIGEGTGLGLSMVYGFARQSGGQARIQSKIGSGTTITLYLPRCPPASSAANEIEEIAEMPPHEGTNALIVDDEATLRSLLQEMMMSMGFNVSLASDASEALKCISSNHQLNLLVTDVGLPGGMNGRQLADAVRSTRPDLKILFITGYAENSIMNRGRMPPGMHILTKPFTIEQLANKLNDII